MMDTIAQILVDKPVLTTYIIRTLIRLSVLQGQNWEEYSSRRSRMTCLSNPRRDCLRKKQRLAAMLKSAATTVTRERYTNTCQCSRRFVGLFILLTESLRTHWVDLRDKGNLGTVINMIGLIEMSSSRTAHIRFDGTSCIRMEGSKRLRPRESSSSSYWPNTTAS